MKKDLSRRDFTRLGALVGAGALLTACGGGKNSLVQAAAAQTIQEPDNTAPNWQYIRRLAINFRGPDRLGSHRVAGQQYGYLMKILEFSPNLHAMIVENAECSDCQPNLAHKTLTTYLLATPPATAGSCDVNYSWTRRDDKTDFVDSDHDQEYMRISARENSALYVSNVKNGPGAQRFTDTEVPMHQDPWRQDISKIIAACQSPFQAVQFEEVSQMARWLHGESDPWGIMTVAPISRDGQGRGKYEISVYNVGENDDNAHQYLGAEFDFATGKMQRIDSRSRVAPDGSFYTSVFAAMPDPNRPGFWQKKYKVDSQSVSSSQLYLPELYDKGI